MPFVYLAVAILAEVVGTSALKASNGFTAWVPGVVVFVAYGVSFFFLSLALRAIPVGVAYAIWSGAGIVLISAIGWVVFGQRLDTGAIVGMTLIVSGVAVLRLFSATVRE